MTRARPLGLLPAKACTGCGKDLARGAFSQTFPDGKEHPLCFGRSYRCSSDICYRKALEKLRICPGCKQPNTVDVGQICRDCHKLIERGHEVGEDESLTFYFIDPGEWVPSTYATSAYVSKDDDELLTAFVDAIATGRTRKNTHAYSEKKECLRRGAGISTSSASWMPGFEGTKKQAAAVKTFLKLFHAQLVTQRKAGRGEGRSLLAGLASGELSMNDWSEQDKKLEEEPS